MKKPLEEEETLLQCGNIEVNNVNNFFVNVWRKNIFDIYVTEYGTALTTILPILFLYLNTVSDSRSLWTVMTAGGLAL